MAAKPPQHYVVRCPPSRLADNQQGQASVAPHEGQSYFRTECVLFCVIAVAVVFPGGVFLGLYLERQFPMKDPVYSVAITGVAGLDPARDVSAGDRPTLSPVFNLTFGVDSARNSRYRACVPSLSTATVSYADAFLAKGSVLPFCAKEKRVSERVPARPWGDSVAMPRFLRNQLAGELAAGEAAVDVQVAMPTYCGEVCTDAVLSCKAKIGGGPSPCRLDFVHIKEHDPPVQSTVPVFMSMPPIMFF